MRTVANIVSLSSLYRMCITLGVLSLCGCVSFSDIPNNQVQVTDAMQRVSVAYEFGEIEFSNIHEQFWPKLEARAKANIVDSFEDGRWNVSEVEGAKSEFCSLIIDVSFTLEETMYDKSTIYLVLPPWLTWRQDIELTAKLRYMPDGIVQTIEASRIGSTHHIRGLPFIAVAWIPWLWRSFATDRVLEAVSAQTLDALYVKLRDNSRAFEACAGIARKNAGEEYENESNE